MYIDRCMDSYPRQKRQVHPRRIPDSYDMWPYGGNYVHPAPFHGCLNRGYLPDLYSCSPHYPHYYSQPYPVNYHGVYPKIQEPYDDVEYGPHHFYSERPRKVYADDNVTGNYHCCACPEHTLKDGKKPFESNVQNLNEVPLQKKSRKVEDDLHRKGIPMKQMEPEDIFKVEKRSLSDEAAAVKIQCAYRGYMVRKWELLKKLKQIVQIRKQVGGVAKRIQALQSSSDYVKDEKQRLIIGETIMSYLLELDAIQGLPSNHKEVRKSVVRELTKLQEMLDALTVNASEYQNGQNVGDSDPKSDEDQLAEEIYKVPVESGHTFQHNEIPVEQFKDEGVDSPDLSKNSGEFNRKLMEENAMLKEEMGKLIEEGKEKTSLISNLTERVKILENTLSRITSTRPRRQFHSGFSY